MTLVLIVALGVLIAMVVFHNGRTIAQLLGLIIVLILLSQLGIINIHGGG